MIGVRVRVRVMVRVMEFCFPPKRVNPQNCLDLFVTRRKSVRDLGIGCF